MVDPQVPRSQGWHPYSCMCTHIDLLIQSLSHNEDTHWGAHRAFAHFAAHDNHCIAWTRPAYTTQRILVRPGLGGAPGCLWVSVLCTKPLINLCGLTHKAPHRIDCGQWHDCAMCLSSTTTCFAAYHPCSPFPILVPNCKRDPPCSCEPPPSVQSCQCVIRYSMGRSLNFYQPALQM